MKYPLFPLVILAFLLSLPAQAQNSLASKIVDKNGSPLYGVNVVLLDSAARKLVKATLTDSTGSFTFSPVDNGTYRLRAVLVGYNTHTTPKFDFPSAGMPSNIILEEV